MIKYTEFEQAKLVELDAGIDEAKAAEKRLLAVGDKRAAKKFAKEAEEKSTRARDIRELAEKRTWDSFSKEKKDECLRNRIEAYFGGRWGIGRTKRGTQEKFEKYVKEYGLAYAVESVGEDVIVEDEQTKLVAELVKVIRGGESGKRLSAIELKDELSKFMRACEQRCIERCRAGSRYTGLREVREEARFAAMSEMARGLGYPLDIIAEFEKGEQIMVSHTDEDVTARAMDDEAAETSCRG
jgi:hypothetical protein